MKTRTICSCTNILFLTSLLFFCNGCNQVIPPPKSSQSSEAGGALPQDNNSSNFSQIPDLPIPPRSSMNIERTFIVGSDKSWFGQTLIETQGDANFVFNFFKKELPGFEWRELSSIRAQTSILTYTRNQRVLAIQISEEQIGLTNVMITVSPRENQNNELLQPIE